MAQTAVAGPLYRLPAYLCQYAADDLRRAAGLLEIHAVSQATALVARAMHAVSDGSIIVDEDPTA